jgi:putative two-component system response regulator
MPEPPDSLCPHFLSAYRILLVDDEPAEVQSLEQLLTLGGYFNHRSVTDSRQALPLYEEFRPDLILLDWQMPHLDGPAVMRQIGARIRPEIFLPILALTAGASPLEKQQALSAGARDFLVKPFDPAEVYLRVRNLLETRHLHLQLAARNTALEMKERERLCDVQDVVDEILDRLSLAAEYRDDLTGGHARRVGVVSERLARAVGVPQTKAELIRRAAALHDLGKVGIPDSILLRAGVLSPEEMSVMRTHTHIGARILSGSRSPVLQMAELIALTHHERWDGTGYSPGLAGEAIPLEGRIVAVADAFDAMVNDRPYRRAMRVEEALEELLRQSGRQFDPRIVEAMVCETQRSLLRLANATEVRAVQDDPAARRGVFPAYNGHSK